MTDDLSESILQLAVECGSTGDLAVFIKRSKTLLTDQEHGLMAAAASEPLSFAGTEKAQWHVPPGAAGMSCSVLPAGWIFGAQQAFASAVSGAFVASGRWMYQVTLLSDGLMQLGWSCWSAMNAWSGKFGVGDFPFTFAYDGQRRKLWNVASTPADGPCWLQGDVISCLIDARRALSRFCHAL
jgi:hypothetical protein